MEVIVERKAQQILGGTVFGIEGSQITSPVQIAMTGKLPCVVHGDEGDHRCAATDAGISAE
ncbi:MAG: hypothetical protein ACFCVA_06770 [Gammaproteobacteria bacterium]